MAESYSRCLVPLPSSLQDGVIVPGNFDGVHHGHAHMLAVAKDIAKNDRPVIAVTFEPHPTRFFGGDTVAPFRLATIDQKKRYLTAAGADAVAVLPFDSALASVSASDFIDEYIVGCCGASHIVIGHDFVFGKGRVGSGDMLRDIADKGTFGLTQCSPFLDDAGLIVSSSRVRKCLIDGKPDKAQALLSRPYTTCCPVIKGDGVAGETLGFPTANIDFGDYLRPKYGAYIGRVTLRGRMYNAAINIGVRPTMFGTRECVEAHVIGDNIPDNFYGETIDVQWLSFIREERRFESFDALKAAIAADVETARRYPAP